VTACVFTGPTLPAADARAVLDAIYLPPVRQGDVYRAAVRYRPSAIGIIDGYFQHVPAVWHKEILWAMAQGIHLFGSASMGALRASELAAFGMHGVGRIFEAYRDGRLEPYEAEPFEDDDEVAVVHALPDAGLVPLSEPMVNIRCTLAAAADAGAVDPATRDALAAIAKGLFYPDRSYERLLARAAEEGLPAHRLAALRAWLPAGRVDQKREDGLAMLAAMRDLLAGDPPPARVSFVFEPSEMWERATVAALAAPGETGDGVPLEALLDELRLDGQAYVRARRAAALRLAGLREAERLRLTASDEARRQAADALRRRFDIGGRRALDGWLADNDLTPAALARLVDDEARLDRLGAVAGPSAEAHLVDHLRATGDYPRHAARARAKAHVLAEAGLPPAPVDEWTRFRLTAWYFEQRLGAAVPGDLPAYAAEIGFADLDGFYRALLREYVYVTHPRAPADRAAPPDGRPDPTGSREAASESPAPRERRRTRRGGPGGSTPLPPRPD
jgi:hypothetical protein